MTIWLILGISAGVAVGGFTLSKFLPWIIRSIQSKNSISKEQYEKNLAMIKQTSKERTAKRETKKAKKEARKELTAAIVKKALKVRLAITVPIYIGTMALKATARQGVKFAKRTKQEGFKNAVVDTAVHGVAVATSTIASKILKDKEPSMDR